MKEDFVTREIAVKLKEKGFKEGCYGYYMPFGDAELIFKSNHAKLTDFTVMLPQYGFAAYKTKE